MTSTDQSSRVIACAVEVWGRTHGGISGLDIAKHLSISHDDVLRILEELNVNGHGSLNRNVELYQVRIDLENPSEKMEGERVTTHMYFPSKEILHRAFFASDLPSKNVPEYKKRLHLGASQIGLVFFTEEVLTRYLDHPELYEIHDSLAGGDVSSLSESPEDRQLYVRYGKSRLKSGKTAVTAIVHDLSFMSASEQRYWYSHEIEQPSIDRTDENFKRFLARTYELSSQYWRQGIGSSAVRAMMQELRDSYGVATFLAVLKTRNFRSLALLQKLGFVPASGQLAAQHRDETDESVMVHDWPTNAA